MINYIQEDITSLDGDCIVNAANEKLLPGSGVCGAIHAAAGPELAEECLRIGHCGVGEARIT
ncbi:MAG: macro domain-containing protein, partial [Candidatus Neomarinimicrobiota bacterium]|nr:macro domain-containing protein [Candidatus Neomarinimicrobiota bacterium]